MALTMNEFTKVSVEREQDAILSPGSIEQSLIGLANQCFGCMDHIVALLAEPFDDRGGNVLVG